MFQGSKGRLVILIAIVFVIKIFALFPGAVEQYYSKGLYPYIGAAQRILLGWIPFSMGDILYAVITIYLLIKAFRFFRALLTRQLNRKTITLSLIKATNFMLWVYILFNVLWGLNYNRLPMSTHLSLTMKQYTVGELDTVMQVLVEELNSLDTASRVKRKQLLTKKNLFASAVEAFKASAKEIGLLEYKHPSIKPSFYSYAGNYLGFSGYYNPFSGEAQVNTTIPYFVQPFVTCHEVGHQLGFAKENEANFAGFLSSRVSPNPAVRYSVYFDMYSYALSELHHKDSIKAKRIHQSLHQQVRNDYAAMQHFFSRYRNPLEPVIRDLYGEYLKANQQPGGLKSYNQVVAMLVAYYKRYGTL